LLVTELTEDAILGGRVRIRQPARGYRVNVDTLLLAASLPRVIAEGARVVEPCCGVGAALLAVAARHEGDVTFVGIERDTAFADVARQNVELNAALHRTQIIEGDALDAGADYGLFDHVFFNPPYDTPGEGRDPSEGKRAAYLADRPIGDWVKVWSNRMRAQATLTLIHRAHRLGEILVALDGRLGGVEVLPIYPNAQASAKRVIVRARKGSRAPLQILRGLNLHPNETSNDKYTPEADAVLRGEALLWFG
jgi:tRNA1(Val) A37 N6-methylase TrmN6